MVQLLYAHGDVKQPLPETVRVLDEILTEFVQGVSFEAVRAAQCAGRQKVKFEDFEFALRRNPAYLGKVQEVFEKKAEIDLARKVINDEDEVLRAEAAADKRERRAQERAGRAEAKRAAAAAAAASSTAASGVVGGGGVDGAFDGMDEEELGEADDDAAAEADALGSRR